MERDRETLFSVGREINIYVKHIHEIQVAEWKNINSQRENGITI